MIPTGGGGIAGSQATENSEEYAEWQQRLSRNGGTVPCVVVLPWSHREGLFCPSPVRQSPPSHIDNIDIPKLLQRHLSIQVLRAQANLSSLPEKEAISELHVSQPNITPQPCRRDQGDQHTYK